MRRQLGKFLEILSREVECYSTLVELLQEERRYIASNDVDRLNEVLKRQNTVILEIKALEEARRALMRKFSEILDLPFEELTLMRLTDVVDEPYSEILSRYGDLIDELTVKIQELNADNSYLIDKSIEYIVGALHIFVSTGAIPKQGSLVCDVA
jgi:flagellar biosynthesis/type III secretory pathway chaperone